MPFWDIDNFRYSVHRKFSNGLLALHGFTGWGINWMPLANQLNNVAFIAPDILGHGDSVANVPLVEAFELISIHLGFLMKSHNIHRFHVLGYSMGGRLALYMAIHYPDYVKSLILESASPGLKTEAEQDARRKADNELADKIEANGIEWFVDYWENLPLWNSQTPEQKAYLREQRLKNDPVGLANSLRGMGTGVMPSLWDELPQLQMPVKLIAGELDSKFVEINREMAQLIPNADLSIVAGAGHTVHLEKPDEYAELVLQFLDKHS
jgi:2-succinyl-6-hydroxy-2,4-cyclohexadiene-1-carboxylate synthase